MGLDLSEARASLLSGDVVELTNATSTDSSSMKLVWEVSILLHYDSIFIAYAIAFPYKIESKNKRWKEQKRKKNNATENNHRKMNSRMREK